MQNHINTYILILMSFLILPLSLAIVMGGLWLITTELVKVLNKTTEQVIQTVSQEVGGAVGQAARSAVAAVVAVVGPVVPPGEIERPEVPDSPPWEDWGSDDEPGGFGADPTDRREPDPESWREDAVGVSPGFKFDPMQPDMSGENFGGFGGRL